MICGHERDVLLWALEHAAQDTWQGNNGLAQFMRLMDRDEGPAEFDALHAVVDPAQLAAIIAELMRERGVSAGREAEDDGYRHIIDWWVDPTSDAIRVEGPFGFTRLLAMPQARAFALKLLDDPTTNIADVIGKIR